MKSWSNTQVNTFLFPAAFGAGLWASAPSSSAGPASGTSSSAEWAPSSSEDLFSADLSSSPTLPSSPSARSAGLSSAPSAFSPEEASAPSPSFSSPLSPLTAASSFSFFSNSSPSISSKDAECSAAGSGGPPPFLTAPGTASASPALLPLAT